MSESKKKTPRRRLRITLRTLLVVVTALCIFLGWYATRARQQRQAVSWLKKNDAEVYYDFELNPRKTGVNPKGTITPPRPRWLVDLLGIDYFANVQFVRITGAEFKDISRLAGLRTIKDFHIGSAELSELGPMRKFRALDQLMVEDSPVKDLSPLSGTVSLQKLFLKNTGVDDLAPLKRLKKLNTLFVVNESFNTPTESDKPVSLNPLAELTNLYSVTLGRIHVADLKMLSGLKNLIRLDLRNVKCNDLESLKGCTRLTSLKLVGRDITDISFLAGHPKLAYLQLIDNDPELDLQPLAEIQSLETVEISGSYKSDLSPLTKLKKLRNLGLHVRLQNLPKDQHDNYDSIKKQREQQILDLKKALPNCNFY